MSDAAALAVHSMDQHLGRRDTQFYPDRVEAMIAMLEKGV